MRIPRPLRTSLLQTPYHPKFARPSRFQFQFQFRASTMESSSSCQAPTQPASQPVFSSNYEPEKGTRDLKPLLLSEEGRWSLIGSGKGVERSFKFKTFKKTWEFMNLVAAECAVQKHHPEWSNVYNTTFIRWTTHSPSGLSEKDVIMARFCDVKALSAVR